MFSILAFFYFIASIIIILWNIRIAWLFSVLTTMLFFILFFPVVALNFLMFVMGHELYKDSPATIFAVISWCMLFVVPTSVILFLVWKNREHIPKIFKFKRPYKAQEQENY
jgi:hypothetical protein